MMTCSICGRQDSKLEQRVHEDHLIPGDHTCRPCQVYYIFHRCEISRRRRTGGLIEVRPRANDLWADDAEILAALGIEAPVTGGKKGP